MRVTSKKIGVGIGILSLLVLAHFFIWPGVLKNLGGNFLPKDYIVWDQQLKRQMYYKNSQASFFGEFKRQEDFQSFSSLDSNQKCSKFFDFFETKYPEWNLKDHREYEKLITNKKAFYKKFASQQLPELSESKVREAFEEQYLRSIDTTLTIEQESVDLITLQRLYGHCFIGNSELSSALSDKYDRWTKKLFPYLMGGRPDVKTYEIVESGSSSALKEVETLSFGEKNGNLIDDIHKFSSGRGIVISGATKHTKYIVKLIVMLRALNNEYPIQIVQREDLNSFSKMKILKAATQDQTKLFDVSYGKQESLNDLKDGILKSAEEYQSRFPVQKVSFVNTKPLFKHSDKSNFKGYFSKLISIIFNSFEEVILMDADTIPLASPKEFFEHEGYLKNSAFFFKDRTLLDRNDFIEANFIAKLCPREDTIDSFFNIPPVTEHTLSNAYMSGLRHCQEAGLIAINKQKHLSGLLMTLTLSRWEVAIKSSVWGDKELYWIGLSIAGDERYDFNPYHAASVGETTSEVNHTIYPDSKAKELCSSHPGHVDKNGKLLWINSGFEFCKKNTLTTDRKHFPMSLYSAEERSKLYQSPLKVREAIVPPEPSGLVSISECHSNFSNCFIHPEKDKKRMDWDDLDKRLKVDRIFNREPAKGWQKNPICAGYQYCAYNYIEEYISKGNYKPQTGAYFQLSEAESRFADYLAKIWISTKIKWPS